jgi:8-oxo-dGTP pyrophosphatase MutT (NUDIX family)
VNREDLLAALDTHAVASPEEAAALERVRRFLSAPADPFARDNPDGHITGSAVIARPDGSAFLLVLHRKLRRWLQPGGHTEESDASAFETALREAREETGIRQLEAPRSDAILDVDVHAIPAHGTDPAHFHHDIRYLLTSDETLHSDNAEDPARPMRWMTLEEARDRGADASLLRALEKARALLAKTLESVADEP